MNIFSLQTDLFDWLKPERPVEPVQDHLPVHPLANREVMHEGKRLRYHLRRGRRTTIGLQAGAQGLVVSAPKWALVSDIRQVVQERAAWAVQKIREAHEREMAHLQRQIVWADGVEIPYLGRPITVRLASQACEEVIRVTQDGEALFINMPERAEAVQIRDRVQAWLMAQARQEFSRRLSHYAPILGVQWTQLRLSHARTRWGSANSQGTICLNWRLIHHALPVIDYVVVHELSHLRVMNHSPAFWDTVASVLPDYKHNMRVLKKEALPPW